jgi:hypothetical protein
LLPAQIDGIDWNAWIATYTNICVYVSLEGWK